MLKDPYVNTCLKYTGETQNHIIILFVIHCANEDRQESMPFIDKIPRGVS